MLGPMGSDPRSALRWTVLGLFLALGVYLRVRGLGELPLHGDEHHTLLAADGSYGAILTTYDTVGSHVPLPLLQKLALDLLGPGVFVFRLPALVPGLLTLLLAYPLLRRIVGGDAAVLASALLAVNPMAIYYSCFARGYALGLLLALLLGWAVACLLAGERRRLARVTLVVAGGGLPWVHLSTLGFVGVLGLTASVLGARQSRARGLELLGSFAAAGGLCLLLYLPVLGQVLNYFGGLPSEDPPLDWFGVPTLIAGGRVEAWSWLVLGTLGLALAWRERREAVLLTLAGAIGPLALLLAKNPPGMDYAWARYLLSPLPFLAAFVAAGFVALLARLPRVGTALALPLGALLCAAQWFAGPFGPRAVADGSFSNTYLALHPLPAFDAPWPGASAFYRELASDPATRLAEVPHLVDRSVFLWRNHALQHGKSVVLGWTGALPRGLAGGPYARVLELTSERADYLVVHKDPVREVAAYFTWVFTDLWPRTRVEADETFMRRQENVHLDGIVPAEVMAGIAAKLRETLGEPCFEDGWIVVWRTRT